MIFKAPAAMVGNALYATLCSTLAVQLCGQGPPSHPMSPPAMAGPSQAAPSSASPHAASMLGDIARTTVNGTDARTGKSFVAGENIYGPFENGFGAAQESMLQSLGCARGATVHVDGGIDTATAEQIIAFRCRITLPRLEEGKYISLLDECGGHTMEYHFHERLSCLYDATSGAHSSQVGQALDNRFLYGKWEHTSSRELPKLDACGGHYGLTPDSPSTAVYHYHVQDRPPFTIGCYGPNDDGTVVTVAQCRSFYSGCDDHLVTITTAGGAQPYDKWCPCFDANGINTGVNFAQLAVFTTTTTTASGLGGWALFRLVPLRVRGGLQTVQLAEVTFRFRGAAVSLAKASASVIRGYSTIGAEPARAIDGLSQTKWVDYDLSPLIIELPQATPIDSYTLITAADMMDSDPVQWRLEGSNDGGTSFEVLHEVIIDYQTPTERSQMMEWFRVPVCLEVTAATAGGAGQACLSTPRLIEQGLAWPATPP